MPKGKDVLAIMLGGKKGGGPESPDPDVEPAVDDASEYGQGFEESAQSAFSSLQDGDVDGFISSLKDAIVTCVEDQERGDY